MGSMVIPQCKTMKELLAEYVALYGKDNWALSTYDGNVSLINNYILPIIGDVKLAMNLSFSCSLRISELLGLTWDCADISEEAQTAVSERYFFQIVLPEC